MASQTIEVGVPGREQIRLKLETDDRGEIISSSLQGIGGPSLMKQLIKVRPQIVGNVDKLPLPEGKDPGSILLRECLLKAKGQWKFPYDEEELCHCRAIPARVVDLAIVVGAHTPEKVRRMTSASTGCGTCQPNVEAIINYRLGRSGEEF